jgi:hypothetical protein
LIGAISLFAFPNCLLFLEKTNLFVVVCFLHFKHFRKVCICLVGFRLFVRVMSVFETTALFSYVITIRLTMFDSLTCRETAVFQPATKGVREEKEVLFGFLGFEPE